MLDFIIPCVLTGTTVWAYWQFYQWRIVGSVSDGGYNWLMLFPQAVNEQWTAQTKPPALQSLAQPLWLMATIICYSPPSVTAVSNFYRRVVLFVLVWWFASRPRPRMAVSGLFVMGYGIARFITEFFRQPDAADQGFILLGGWQKGKC